jgi:hypothetical protein
LASPLSGLRFDRCRRLRPFSMAVQLTIRGCATPRDRSIVLWYRLTAISSISCTASDQSPQPRIQGIARYYRPIDSPPRFRSYRIQIASSMRDAEGRNALVLNGPVSVSNRRKCFRKSNFEHLGLGCHGACDGGPYACGSCRSHLGWSQEELADSNCKWRRSHSTPLQTSEGLRGAGAACSGPESRNRRGL